MDEPLPNLRAGLKNVGDGLHLERHDRLLRSLEAAAESFDSDKVKSAAMALDAVMTCLRNERLEAPLRFLVNVLDERQRKGRRTGEFPKPIKLGVRAVGWLEQDIVSWQQARIEARTA